MLYTLNILNNRNASLYAVTINCFPLAKRRYLIISTRIYDIAEQLPNFLHEETINIAYFRKFIKGTFNQK